MIRRCIVETILIEALKFIGASAVGGITWDIMKESGSRLLVNFKKHFVNDSYFKDESQAEDFLRDISSKESLNKRRPLEDVWSVYDNCTSTEASDLFKTEFIDWMKAHGEDLEHLGECAVQEKGFIIGKQVNKDNAKVTNIGNQYNYNGI